MSVSRRSFIGTVGRTTLGAGLLGVAQRVVDARESSDHTIHVVQPGFNTIGLSDRLQDLEAFVDLSIFDPPTRALLESGRPFTLVLGDGFEARHHGPQPDHEGCCRHQVFCARLNSPEQLKFLRAHGMRRIVMSRSHPILIQNARALGIEVVTGGE